MRLGQRIAILIALGLTLFAARPSSAGVARAIALADLVKASDLIAIGTPVDAYSVWETVGTHKRIVTYSRVLVEETVAGQGTESEILVRSLGGRVGTIGQIVHGEPVVVIGQRAMLFARHAPDGTVSVTARSQGYFPVLDDGAGTLRLSAPLGAPHLIGNLAGSALRELIGLTPADATQHVRAVMHP